MQIIGNTQELGRYSETISLIDEIFIFSRKRKLSLAQRFPKAYGPENKSNIYCIVDHDIVVSAVVAQKFSLLINQENRCTGYMIGGVVTHPEFCKKGLASRLLSEVEDNLQDADFLILWTGIPDFYFRLGWQAGKRGIFGRLSTRRSNNLTNGFVCNKQIQNQDHLNQVELFRVQHELPIVENGEHSRYLNLPIPAEKVEIWTISNRNNELEAYCVVGNTESIGYIYEQAGDSQSMQIQLDDLRAIYSNLYFNADNLQDDFYRAAGALEINPGPYCLVKNRSSAIEDSTLRQVYIPYLDRI